MVRKNRKPIVATSRAFHEFFLTLWLLSSCINHHGRGFAGVSLLFVEGFIVGGGGGSSSTVTTVVPTTIRGGKSTKTITTSTTRIYSSTNEDSDDGDNDAITASDSTTTTTLMTASGNGDVNNADDDSSYKWPDNLYLETRDMAAVSFLVYSFAYATDVARKIGLIGLDETNAGRVEKNQVEMAEVEKEMEEQEAAAAMPTSPSTSTRSIKFFGRKKKKKKSSSGSSSSSYNFPRSFTPQEVLTIMQQNQDTLAKYYPDWFSSNSKQYQLMLQNIQTMQELVESKSTSDNDRPLTLEEYDDRHQKHELVYGIAKDDINKRITLVFRGTENELAFQSNWSTNLFLSKTKGKLPEVLKDDLKLPGFWKSIWFHSGFYKYVFDITKDENDDETWRKYDEIVVDVKRLLERYPNYKLYVTGHSLGGGLSTLVSFYLACEPDIPKPVTCINFASPRMGDPNFLQAVQELEQRRWLRMLRVVNDNDSIAMFPCINYEHVGFQVRLFKDKNRPPILRYPSKKETPFEYWDRVWFNSLFASFNFGYDHGDYRERVDQNKEFFENLDLNDLYKNSTLTGFE